MLDLSLFFKILLGNFEIKSGIKYSINAAMYICQLIIMSLKKTEMNFIKA